MKYIELPSGHKVKVDDEDYVEISGYRWHLSNGYASRHRNDGSGSKIYMHRIISDTPNGMHTDHINGDKLDNRRSNLRVVTASQNHMNRRKESKPRRGITSEYKGVSLHKPSGLWRARIKTNGKQLSLGYYKTPEEAHKAYCAGTKEHFGDYGYVG